MSRILVAEDVQHMLCVISVWLSRLGHEVLEARSGAAALELYDHSPPDIVVTDINMPVMGGVELLNQITTRTRLPRGIVVLTNRWDHREIGQALQDIGVHTVPKPFSPSKLAELIDKIVPAKPAGNAL